jgi:hypothetical protein
MYHIAFGVILGMGWLTIVPFASYYLLVIALVMVGNVTLAVVAMVVFGITRSVPFVLLSRGILRQASSATGGQRSVARRRTLHRIADVPAMWALRACLSIAVLALVVWRW